MKKPAKKISALFLALLMVLSLIPTGALATDTYTVSLSAASAQVDAGGEERITLSVSHDTAQNYNAFYASMTYDAEKFSYAADNSELGDFSVSDSETPGTLTISRYGNDFSVGNALTLSFTAREEGEGSFALAGAQVDTSVNSLADAAEAACGDSVTVTVTGASSALTPDYTWYTADGGESETAPYEIANASQLLALANLVNGTYVPADVGEDTAEAKTFEGKYVELTDNITLDTDGKYTTASEVKYGTDSYCIVTTQYSVNDDALIWTPIGTGTSTSANVVATANYFAGTFNGSGNTVSGLYTDGTAQVQGLFGCVSGTVKNLTVSGCVTAHSIAGGIAAYLNGGTIENCTNNAVVFTDGGTTPDGGVENGLERAGANGGIVGLASGTALPFEVTGCVNSAVVIGANSHKGGRTGGIIGLVNNTADCGLISDCLNTGSIDAYQYAGGIIGMNWSANVPIKRCANQAAIQGQSPGSTYVGGITAYSCSPISDCYNTGNIKIRKEGTENTKVAHAGGIISDLSNATVTNCYNTGSLTYSGYNITAGCSSYGAICGTGYGYTGSIKLSNCYTSVTSNAEDYKNLLKDNATGALELKTEAEMRAPEFLPLLNGGERAFVSDNATPVNGGYPILRCQMIPEDTSTLASVTLGANPTKTAYVIGQTFNPAGMEVRANYSDGSYELVADYAISNTDALTQDDSSVTISGTYEGISYSFNVPITVAQVGLASIAVTTPPAKTLYEAGEYFHPTDMVVTATYTDDNTAVITDYTFQPDVNTALTADMEAVTVSYSEDGITATATTPIIVVTTPEKDENDTYDLDSVKDVLWLANQVNSKGNTGINAELTANIDLYNTAWTPVGTSGSAYSGSFNGGGYSVTLNISDGDYQALFGYVNGASICDLTVKGTVSGGQALAGIAASAENTAFDGCVNRAVITGSGANLGGIAAIADSLTTFTNCGNDAAISGGYSLGGIVGEFGSTDAAVNTGAITDSYNIGTISGIRNVGGIAGAVRNAYAITNVYNTAAIAASGSGSAYGVGGVVGLNAGGTLTNAYNIGTVTAASGGSVINAGAIAGRIDGGNTTNCYYLKDSAAAGIGLDNTGAATAPTLKTDTEMQSADFVTALNGDGSAFKAGSGDYLYPILSWQSDGETSGTAWDGTAITEVDESDASGSAGLGYYRISTGAQLAWLAQEVNSGTDFSGKTVVLLNDIDLGGHEWTPVGKASVTITKLVEDDDRYGDTGALDGLDDHAFNAIFDGGGYTVSGLSITGTNSAVALFGNLGENGEIKNLTVSGSVAGAHFVGGVAAVCRGNLESVTNKVVVNATGDYVGGVAAEGVGSITITDCHNCAAISNSSNTRSSGRVAGIIGRVDSGSSATITCCSNTAEIYGYQYVGGIIGGQFGDVDVSCCYNTADITGASFGKVYLGGIAGKLQNGTISYCYNTGDLYDAHWSAGHIRAVGGIAGCEENHTTGTAITNCYTTGTITFNTSNMTYGTNWIYMVGHISGGNSATSTNTMSYKNCYYLEDTIPQADSASDDYQLWSDLFKENPLVWDTSYITSKTETDMKDAEFLNGFTASGYFVTDGNSINEGYPILYWQSGQKEPEATAYGITASTIGSGSATVELSSSTATAGTAVTVYISDLASDKQVRCVTATDAAGNTLDVTAVTADAAYEFTMPNRNVTVTVTIENKVTGGTTYALTLPDGLDAIWTVSAGSSYETDGKITAGASVFLTVEKDEDARMTSLKGVNITTASDTVTYDTLSYLEDSDSAGVSGVYLFTMPEADVTVTLDIEYADISVYSQTGSNTATLAASYTREQMVNLAGDDTLYYSGYYSETEPFIGKAEQAVTLTDLLKAAGVSFTSTDTLKVTSTDGMSLYFSYDKLYGSQRYYYPNLISGSTSEEKAEGATAVDSMFVIKGYLACETDGSVENYTCDTLNAYRFVFGQTETEFNNGVPAVEYKAIDKMPKYVSAVTVIKPSSSGGEGGDTGSGNVNAAVWDGYSLDVSWFNKNTYDTTDSYYISTPAQLAGLAALVNGIYNEEIDTFAGDTSAIVANWSDTSSVGPNGQNMSTSNYCIGNYSFMGKTVYLTDDIDMSGGNYMPVGGQYLMTLDDHTTKISASFCGTFDGQGHSVTIECNRYCSDGNFGDGESVGLVGRLGVHDNDDANLRPVNPTVRNVAVYGSVYANRSVGGIVGKIGKNAANNSEDYSQGAIIENCANFATISNTDSKGCGGICGAAWNGGFIRNCYNAGNISTTYTCPTGGIAGSNEITLQNCYNIGNIFAPTARFGMAIGSFNSNHNHSVMNCYWLTGSATGGGYYGDSTAEVEELTSAQMKSGDFLNALGSAFAEDTKNINNGYPVLAWQAPAGTTTGTGGTSSESKTTTVDVTAKMSGTTGNASLTSDVLGSAVTKALEAAETDGTKADVKINVETADGCTSLKTTVPSTALSSAASSGISSLTISSDLGSATLSSAVLSSVASQAGSSDVTVTLSQVETSSLTAEQQTAVGDGTVVNLSITAGDSTITSFSGEEVSFSLPVSAKVANGKTANVYYLNSRGQLIPMDGTYNSSTGIVTFTTPHLSNYVLQVEKVWTNSFADVSSIDWYYSAVRYTSKAGLFDGTTETEFSPNTTMTRAMLVTVIWRMEGEPTATPAGFADVAEGQWYYDAVNWAAANGIVSGYDDKNFGPNDVVTREQAAAILFRYAKTCGYSVSASADLSGYTDQGSISSWAKTAMSWANASGLITGTTTTTLSPDNGATRAQVATILMRFMKGIAL